MRSDLTYAIGDIHGCHELFMALLQGIEEHAAGQTYRLVLLGDYVDRGPDSASVLNTIRELQARFPENLVCLMGNHEAMMLEAVEGQNGSDQWLWNGGDATLASFGVSSAQDLPRDLIAWVRQLPTFYEDERRYYVHAGVHPMRSLADQNDQDRLWIREPFLEVEHDFGKHIVHGHTPLRTPSPDERRFRTNLDTAAVFGGALTAGAFTADQDHALVNLRVLANEGA